MDTKYYTSERFIWDNIKQAAEGGIPSIYDSWKKSGRIDPFIISWPSERVLDDNNLPIEDACLLDLPRNQSKWAQTIGGFVMRTKAYALLLTEQKEREVSVILESHHGTRSWSIPILSSGDVRVLGEARTADDKDSLGILWRKRMARS